MARKKTTVNHILNEVILYGGIPLRRRDVYADALTVTGNARAADRFTFTPKALDGVEPWSLEEFNSLTGGR